MNSRKITAVIAAVCLASALVSCSNIAQDDKETAPVSENAAATEAVTGTPSEETIATAEETEKHYEAPSAIEYPDKRLELSGDHDDIIKVDENSYVEGDGFYLFILKGSTVRGDYAVNVRRVMDELEKLYGMSFDMTDYAEEDDWKDFYYGGSFKDINTDFARISILVMPDPGDGTIEWAWKNEVKLFDTDLDCEGMTFDTVYHELAHVLRMHQGEGLGQVMEEGVALYAQDKLARTFDYPDWSIIQYIDTEDGFTSPYDHSEIIKDPEGVFAEVMTEERNTAQRNYQYGIRFVTFLMEEYGPDVILKISEVSRGYEFDENDADTVIEIIKTATSDDVFERFAAWLPEGWDAFCNDYVSYMRQFGL